MQSEPDKPASPEAARSEAPLPEPELTRPVRPIAELLADPLFPKNALGEVVDIGGYTGVISDISNQSVRVRSPEGATKSFNLNGLRRIYGPRVLPEPLPTPSPAPVPVPMSRETPRTARTVPVEKKEVALEPDFSKPVTNIRDYVGRADFPQCVLGQHVEISGYTGVVVQIVNRSLKVRSETETTRSYNADALRKLYGH